MIVVGACILGYLVVMALMAYAYMRGLDDGIEVAQLEPCECAECELNAEGE